MQNPKALISCANALVFAKPLDRKKSIVYQKKYLKSSKLQKGNRLFFVIPGKPLDKDINNKTQI